MKILSSHSSNPPSSRPHLHQEQSSFTARSHSPLVDNKHSPHRSQSSVQFLVCAWSRHILASQLPLASPRYHTFDLPTCCSHPHQAFKLNFHPLLLSGSSPPNPRGDLQAESCSQKSSTLVEIHYLLTTTLLLHARIARESTLWEKQRQGKLDLLSASAERHQSIGDCEA